jgi:hypothetical protein
VPKRSPKRAPRAAIAALTPVVELFLKLGVTSPEAETLLRAVYVHTVKRRISKSLEPGQKSSDVRIALVTGIHRNFVRKILAESPAILTSRQWRGSSVSRLISAWRADPKYIDTLGRPLDIAEKDGEPNFKTLVQQYLPGVTPAVALSELRRARQVELISGHRLRLLQQSSKLSE